MTAGAAARSVGRFVLRLPTTALMVLVRGYQLLVSPLLGPSCRFYPSCSAYGLESLRVHGAVRGTWLTIRRLLRCHPWNPGGVDEVPPARAARGARPGPSREHVHEPADQHVDQHA